MLWKRRKATDYHSYVIIRKDLPDSQKTVQACHAVWEIAQKYDSPSLVAVVVKDEEKLKKTMKILEEKGIKYSAFREPMSPYNNCLTAVCTEPLYGEERNPLRKYQLL